VAAMWGCEGHVAEQELLPRPQCVLFCSGLGTGWAWDVNVCELSLTPESWNELKIMGNVCFPRL